MRCCGASIKANDLILVTVSRDTAAFSVEAKASRRLTLGDNTDQGAVRAFLAALKGFVQNNSIEHIAVRGRQTKGKFAGGSTSFKIEGLLQILDGCSTTIVSPQAIAAWVKRNKAEIPAAAYAYQRDAVEAACIAMSG